MLNEPESLRHLETRELITLADLNNDMANFLTNYRDTSARVAGQRANINEISGILDSIFMYFKMNYPNLRTAIIRFKSIKEKFANYEIHVGNSKFLLMGNWSLGIQFKFTLMEFIFSYNVPYENMENAIKIAMTFPNLRVTNFGQSKEMRNYKYLMTFMKVDDSSPEAQIDRYQGFDRAFINIHEELFKGIDIREE